MNGTRVIDVRNLSKGYRVYPKMSDVLKEAVFGGVRHDVFWALRDINFQVAEGERIGIVGANGAGKSTLLKIIAGNLSPSTGTATANGRISALLNLIPALRQNETGLENIKLNLLMSGAKRSELPHLVEDIIDFTELSSFIYRPVRTYSSGMQARLAFAVATTLTPEILIVDEVLSTGDAYFQGKAEQRMRSLCARGKALLFVSHSTAAILNLCDRAIWLENGSVRMDSTAEHTIKSYIEDSKRQEDVVTRPLNAAAEQSEETSQDVDEFKLFAEGVITLRIVSEGGRFGDTHFITNMEVQRGDDPPSPVPLDFIDIESSDDDAHLDVVGTEWGRLHSREGIECRTLAPKVGRRRGGPIKVREPAHYEADSFPVSVRFDWLPEHGRDVLAMEYLDRSDGEWKTMEAVGELAQSDQWNRLEFIGHVPRPKAKTIEAGREAYAAKSRPSVEIVDVSVQTNGERTTVVEEGRPFDIVVGVTVNRATTLADVCLKIERSDGVYVFWQSSGMTGENFTQLENDFSVQFRFEPNFLGFGTYVVSVLAGNGWDPENNFPHSQVFDRKVNMFEFKIMRSHPRLDRGLINETVKVTRIPGLHTETSGNINAG